MTFWDIVAGLNKKELETFKDDETSDTGDSRASQSELTQGDTLFLSNERIIKYKDYDEMDRAIPEVANALDIMADDVTAVDIDQNEAFWIHSGRDSIVDMLKDMYFDKLGLDTNLWSIARDMIKYGDDFEEIVVSSSGIERLKPLPASTVYRLEDNKGRVLKYEQRLWHDYNTLYASIPNLSSGGKDSDGSSVEFVPWQIQHLRLQSMNRASMYGTSFLERARDVGLRLKLMEEALAMKRLHHSFDRYVYYVEVQGLDPEKALKYVDELKRRVKRSRFVDQSGSFSSTINPTNPIEDLWIPIRNGQDTTRVDTLKGLEVGQAIEDLKYMRSKLISALKVPAAYLGYTEDYTGFVNNTMEYQDKRYIRTIRRYQSVVKDLLYRLAEIQMDILEIPYADRQIEIFMNSLDTLEEQAKAEIMKVKAELARDLTDMFPLDWILENIFNIPTDEIKPIVMKMSGAAMDNMDGAFNESKTILKDLRSKGISESQLVRIVNKAVATNPELRNSLNELKSIVSEHSKMTKSLSRTMATKSDIIKVTNAQDIKEYTKR